MEEREFVEGGIVRAASEWSSPREDHHLSSFGAQQFQKRDTHSLGTRKNPVGTLT